MFVPFVFFDEQNQDLGQFGYGSGSRVTYNASISVHSGYGSGSKVITRIIAQGGYGSGSNVTATAKSTLKCGGVSSSKIIAKAITTLQLGYGSGSQVRTQPVIFAKGGYGSASKVLASASTTLKFGYGSGSRAFPSLSTAQVQGGYGSSSQVVGRAIAITKSGYGSGSTVSTLSLGKNLTVNTTTLSFLAQTGQYFTLTLGTIVDFLEVSVSPAPTGSQTCRVRIYIPGSYQAADLTRAFTTWVGFNNGILVDAEFTNTSPPPIPIPPISAGWATSKQFPVTIDCPGYAGVVTITYSVRVP